MGKTNDSNHANQLNPNHDSYWQSRGHDERPDDWEDQIEQQQQHQDSPKK